MLITDDGAASLSALDLCLVLPLRKRDNVSNIMSSSDSETRFSEPLARCSANFDFNSSNPMGSPEEFRKTLKRRVRLYHCSILQWNSRNGDTI